MMSIVTDDLHTCDLAETGHLDHHLKLALGAGLPSLKGHSMVTVNAARAFELTDIGAFGARQARGHQHRRGRHRRHVRRRLHVVARQAGPRSRRNARSLRARRARSCLLNTTRLLNPVTPDSFKIAAPEGASKVKVLCMDTLPWIPITQPREVELDCVDGYVRCDVEQDVLYIAQVERYGKNGNIGKAFMGGFHMTMELSPRRWGTTTTTSSSWARISRTWPRRSTALIEIGGGQILVDGGELVKGVRLPGSAAFCPTCPPRSLQPRRLS